MIYRESLYEKSGLYHISSEDCGCSLLPSETQLYLLPCHVILWFLNHGSGALSQYGDFNTGFPVKQF